jgi:hypothetical protein
MSELYPLKFETVLKEKVWGGNALVTKYNKKATRNCQRLLITSLL